MRAIVIGANGFVGSHLVERLVRQGVNVVCLVRPAARMAMSGPSVLPSSFPPVIPSTAEKTGGREEERKGGEEGIPNVEIIRDGMENVETLARAFSDRGGTDIVFHVAGRTRGRTAAEYTAVNVDLTRRLVEAAATCGAVRRFVYVSSMAAVGPNPTDAPMDEATEPRSGIAFIGLICNRPNSAETESDRREDI